MLAFLVLWLYWQVSSALLLLGALICLPNTTWLMWTYHSLSSRYLLAIRYTRPARPTERFEAEPCMYCCNHRCWGDFFMDNCVVGGGAYMARWLAAVAVPASAVLGWFTFTTEPFTRSPRNKEHIYRVARALVRRGHNIICYPEGTRNLGHQSKDLKWGLVRFAYREKVKVQMVMTTNKEVVWNERAGAVRRGITCGVFHGPVLSPDDHETIEAWCAAFQADWDALWSRSYGTEPMVPWEPTLGTRARHSPDRLVAARRALVAVAAVAAVWVGVLGH